MSLSKILKILISFTLLFFLSQCCTSNEQIDKNYVSKKINHPNSPLPFGAADVTGTILKLINENSKKIGLFKIDSVHGYGPSTRPIGIGSRLNIEFSDRFFQRNENFSLEILKKDTKHRLLIMYIEAGVNTKDKNMWQIINIKSRH